MEVNVLSPTFLEIQDASHVGEARRRAMTVTQAVGFDEVQSGNVSIIVTELANNLLRHATGGYIVLQWITTEHGDQFEILSVDRGPGMTNVSRSLQDGYTTAGTPGNGLGAVRRLSGEFDIYSMPSQGTVVVSRVRGGNKTKRSPATFVRWGVYSRPKDGESVCGDAWRATASAVAATFMVCDGLGHGPIAAEAAAAVTTAYDRDSFAAPDQFLGTAHRHANGSRGAAVAMARLEASGEVHYAGVGNISGVLIAGETTKSMLSHNGIVGVRIRKPQSYDYSLPHNGLLIMFSDGLKSRWTFSEYPGLQTSHPSIIAAVLARDLSRHRDDVTVLVAKSQRITGNGHD